tara:strand:- start:7159 stop:7515 length:357 start_codon:yes stop_codon:yes gene_type:complete
MASKAALVKELKARGIPVPKGATVEELQHRLDVYLPGDGFLLRLARPASRKPWNPVVLMEPNTTYWVANSTFAQHIIESKLVFVLGREPQPLSDTTYLEIPKDYPEAWNNGSDGSADS